MEFNKFFHKTSKKMDELNKDYQAMSKNNNNKRIEIKESIDSKAKDFQSRKQERRKIFEITRNK